MRIAVLEDHAAQRLLLVRTLERLLTRGDDVVVCHEFSDGLALQRILRTETFDLLVFDWDVPGLDGLELVKWLGSLNERRAPILMLTGRSAEQDVVRALDAGAADYVIKPPRPAELQARIERLLNRATFGMLRADKMRIGRWSLDGAKRRMLIEPEPGEGPLEQHELSERECALLRVLFRNVGRAISRGHLIDGAGFSTARIPETVVDVQMSRLRKKLRFGPERGLALSAVYGRGYRLDHPPPVARRADRNGA